jgi:two-component system cell cycle sensor histidine kinase/response regulator CckA
MTNKETIKEPEIRFIFFFLTVIILALITGGYLYYHHNIQAVQAAKEIELKVIAELKVEQIQAWRNERLIDASMNSSGIIRKEILQWLRSPADQDLKKLLSNHWQDLQDNAKYQNIILTSSTGKILLTLDSSVTELESDALQLVNRAIVTGHVVFGDFYRCIQNERIHLDLTVPIFDDSETPLAALLLRTDPDIFLYPFIQTWPTLSESAETLIFRQNGQEIVFLNRLRHQPDSVLKTCIPLTKTDNSAVQGVMGKTGIIRGKDYRGEEVVSYIQRIPDTDWFMEAKINTDEIFSEAQTRGGYILLLFSLFVAMAALVTILLLNRRKSNLYRKLFSVEQQLSQSKAIMAASSDAIFVTDPITTRFVEANDTACIRLGYSREELLNMTVQEVNPIFPMEDWSQYLKKVHEKGNLLIETFHQKKDGTIIPVEVNVRSIQVGGSEYLVSTARDVTERNRMEKELWEVSQRLDLILAATQTNIDIIDHDYNLLYVDKQWQKIYGDFTNRKCYEYFLGLEKPCEDCVIHEVMQTKQTVVLERTLFKENNRVIEVHTIPLKDISGKWVVAKFNIDITKQKRAEKALRESEEKFRLLVQSTDDIIFTLDAQQRHTSVYGQWLGQSGLSEDKFLGKTAAEIFGEEAAEIHTQSNLLALRGEFVKYEWSAKLEGKEHFYQTSLSPMKNSEGKVFGLVGIGRDITALKKAEKAQRDIESRFQKVVEGAPDAIYIETNRQFNYLNPASCKLFGAKSPEELLGQPVMDRIHPSVRERARQRIHLLNVEKQSVPLIEQIYLRLDGSEVPVEVTAVPIFYQGKDGALAFVRDITERKKDEEEHSKLAERIQISEKMEVIGSLAGGIAHDFNNLLSVITGYTDLILSSDCEDDSIRENLTEVRKATERATALTQQLLTLSRKQVVHPELIQLNQIIIGMEKMLKQIIGEKIDLIQTLSPELGLTLADPNQLEQVVMNLVVNARDAMPNGGKIIIETANVELDEKYTAQHVDIFSGPYIMLTISDRGSGMDEQTKLRIFEPFFTTKTKGTGLGLSTVYGIVKQNKGHIWVYSEPGEGTTFKIYLKRETLQKIIHKPTVPVESQNPRGTETVLVVDDEQSVRNLVKKILSNVGYTVLSAASGPEALQILNQDEKQVQLVLTDIVMPEMSGKKFSEHLLKLFPKMKIIYMSGYTDNAIQNNEIYKNQIISIISKPFSTADLTHKVREVLDGVMLSKIEKNEKIVLTHKTRKNGVILQKKVPLLPIKIYEDLRQATLAARYDDLVQIIEKIHSIDINLAELLYQLVDEYNYDGILDLIDDKGVGEKQYD